MSSERLGRNEVNGKGYPPDFAVPAECVWMDGEFVHWAQATVHVSSLAFTQGASIFEGIRAYWNNEKEQLYILKLDEHLNRLFNSMKMIRLTIPFSKQDLAQAVVELLSKNKFREDVYLRVNSYFGLGDRQSVDPTQVYMGACITAVPSLQPHIIERGINCCVSSWERSSDRVQPPRIKAAANYFTVRLSTIQAKVDGYDEALLLNHEGRVSEAPNACLFIVRNGVVITPEITNNILESITRATLLNLFHDELDTETMEREVDRTELYLADEVFLCGTGREITPVVSIDRLLVGDGRVGSLTRQIQSVYFDAVCSKNEKYKGWLLPVYDH
jgi:branched-chain amino acid aminotransferase